MIKATFLALLREVNYTDFMKEKKVEVKKYPIRLGQFLKLAEVASDGNEAKFVIASGIVLVNGHADVRRGRKLVKGDKVQVENNVYLCS